MELSRTSLLLIAPALLAGCSVAAEAQDAADPATEADARVARMLMGARSTYAPDAAARQCREKAASGEIVVCAQDDSQFRMPSTSQSDPNSDEALKDGQLRPPDLEKKYPGVVAARGCFLPPCPKGPLYIIDLSAIPETPPGSDADKVARGEIRDR